MAEEKKPESRASKMYAKSAEKKAEPAKKEEKKAEPKAEAKKDDKPAEGGDDKTTETSPAAKQAEARMAMHKRHEGERKDFHGNMREQMRQMATRHNKEIVDMNAAHEGELAATPAAGGEPSAEPAGGGE